LGATAATNALEHAADIAKVQEWSFVYYPLPLARAIGLIGVKLAQWELIGRGELQLVLNHVLRTEARQKLRPIKRVPIL